VTADHELVRRVAAVLRAQVAPATEGAQPRSQAFRASAVLNRLARRLELADAHAAAEQEDRRMLVADLRELIAGLDAPAVVAALDLHGDHKTALARLVDAVHDDRDRMPPDAFESVLARVRRAVRADLDRDLEIAR
jgi:hypothetical protein